MAAGGECGICITHVSQTEQSDPPAKPSRRPEDRAVVQILRAVDVCFSRLYHRITVKRPQRLPREGAAILVCNHTSGLDPMLIQSVCPRSIVWMMAREYYEIKALKWFFQIIGAIPVDRSGRDLAATRAALRALQEGRILGLFPEGRIETTTELLPFQTGVAMMAIKTGADIYPVYLDGTQRGKKMVDAFKFRNHATLTFGPVLKLSQRGTSKEELEAATESIRQAVAALMPRRR